MKVGAKAYRGLMIVSLLVLAIELVLDTQRDGDFIGYIYAGLFVLKGKYIYLNYLNTWPPFFSIVCVPLALLDSYSPTLVRLVWLLGNFAALFATMAMSSQIFLKKKLLLPFVKLKESSQVAFENPIVFIPFLIMLRLIMEHSSHLQINLYMLAMATASVYFYYKKRPVLAAFFLGFSIAIKVYTVILLLYFLYKRAYKLSLLTISWIGFFILLTFAVFGVDEAIALHLDWYAKASVQRIAAHHMNQSLFALIERLFVYSNTGMDLHNNFFDLPLQSVKKVYYVLLVLVSLVPMYLFRRKLEIDELKTEQVLEWAVIFCIIPVLSPVAWKYYFVFLWVPFFVFYYLLFTKNLLEGLTSKKWAKALFYISIICLVGSSELFVGPYFSDVLELYGIITISAICLLVALFILYLKMPTKYLEKEASEL